MSFPPLSPYKGLPVHIIEGEKDMENSAYSFAFFVLFYVPGNAIIYFTVQILEISTILATFRFAMR